MFIPKQWVQVDLGQIYSIHVVLIIASKYIIGMGTETYKYEDKFKGNGK